MRVAHISDLHVEVPPRPAQLLSKRAIGAMNLYLLGRHAHFAPRTVIALVEALLTLKPDLVVCTGDLTATATPEEFARAAELLSPITDRFPFVVIPGNHDVYTRGSVGRFDKWFGAWSNGGAYPFARHHGGVSFVAADVVRPDVLSRGFVPRDQLDRLARLLETGTDPVVVLLHYPLRGRHGAPYGPTSRALANAREIEAILADHERVVAVLHGHEHHGFRTKLPRAGGGDIHVLDPGASGYAFLPDRGRTAHFNVYDIEGFERFEVERHAFDGERFSPEPGGAYASGG